jgi:hypothetical protein
MSAYWDSSALLNAIVSEEVAKKIAQGDIARSHGFCEVFSLLTGRGIPTRRGRMVMTNADAARVIEKLASKLTLRDLTCLKLSRRFATLSGLASKAGASTT